MRCAHVQGHQDCGCLDIQTARHRACHTLSVLPVLFMHTQPRSELQACTFRHAQKLAILERHVGCPKSCAVGFMGSTCRCTAPARSPSLTHTVMPQLAALAAAAAAAAPEAALAAAAAAAPSPSLSTSASSSAAGTQADKEAIPWFNCPISLVSLGSFHCCQQAYVSVVYATTGQVVLLDVVPQDSSHCMSVRLYMGIILSSASPITCMLPQHEKLATVSGGFNVLNLGAGSHA